MKKISIFLLILALLFGTGCQKETTEKNSKVLTTAATQTNQAKSPYVTKIIRLNGARNSLVLVSFNGGNFGKSKSAEELEFIAEMFREADLIAIQEVSTSDFGAQAVARLADDLNRKGNKWDYVISNSTHKSKGRERFGFLWKTRRINALPRSANLINSLEDSLEREPAKMFFKVNDKSFSLMSFHLVPTKKNPLNEVIALGHNPDVFPANNAIIVGDFNLGHEKLNSVFENQLNFRHQIEGKTSLKSKLKDGNYYMREYDNIFVRGNITICQVGILDFVPSFSDLSVARKISDHLPVFIEFILN
ncbi:MAG: endonuclease/exonuclease/phosphatase family protein [Candidatus Moraniibacteriota bacterium]